MIRLVKGNIFDSKMQTLVNPVNTVGVMGAGLAKQFKERYPQMFIRYKKFCDNGQLSIGNLWLYQAKSLPWVLCMPTKRDWRQPSRPEWVDLGIKKLADNYKRLDIHSIAIPKLGAGLGGLDFDLDVYPSIEFHLEGTDLEVEVYI